MELLKFVDTLPRLVRKSIFSVADIMVIILAYLLTNVFKETKVDIFSQVFINSVVTAVVIYMLVFYLMHIYRLILRYSSAKEYLRIGTACMASIIILSCLKYVLNYATMSPLTNTLAGVLVCFMAISYRVFLRIAITYMS